MKIALVHELLTMKGGAERVLRVLADHFPDAPIYTLLYDEKTLGDWFPASRVQTGNGRSAGAPLLFPMNHHVHLRRFPSVVESWDFSAFDIVLSSSSAFAHGIITNNAPRHLCYVHSPARYLWDRAHDVLDRAGKGLLGPLKCAYLSRVFHDLRIWDAEAADRADALIAASTEVQRRIELYWRRESTVIHPPIDDFWYANQELDVRAPWQGAPTEYYVVVSQLVPYKRIDLAIRACNERKIPLKIAGDGPARRSLQRIAGPTVEFLGYRKDAELRELYAGARATLFPGEEDFGLVPLESMACGTPVIAYRGGGALETVAEGTTGEFFDRADPASMIDAMKRLEEGQYDPAACRAQAARFSAERFLRAIDESLSALAARG